MQDRSYQEPEKVIPPRAIGYRPVGHGGVVRVPDYPDDSPRALWDSSGALERILVVIAIPLLVIAVVVLGRIA